MRGAAAQARAAPGLQARGHLRRGVLDLDGVPVLDLRRGMRGESEHPAQDHDPGRRPEPHRPGHRVRLLLRARRHGAVRGRLRDHHGELQSGDGLDRLRHLGPAVLRAADASRTCMEIIEKEKPEGVIVQYGGQTPLKLSRALAAAGAPIIGTTPDSIDVAEDRERFQKLVASLKLKQPANATARDRGTGGDHGARGGLPAGGAPELRARRPRHGGGVQRGRPAPVHDRRGQGLERQPGAARSIPGPRHRGGRGCGERRRERADRRHHGAHRAGRACIRATRAARCRRTACRPRPRRSCARRRASSPRRSTWSA